MILVDMILVNARSKADRGTVNTLSLTQASWIGKEDLTLVEMKFALKDIWKPSSPMILRAGLQLL